MVVELNDKDIDDIKQCLSVMYFNIISNSKYLKPSATQQATNDLIELSNKFGIDIVECNNEFTNKLNKFISNKSINIVKAIEECKQGKKVRLCGWESSHIEYIPASKKFVVINDDNIQWFTFNILDGGKWEVLD